MDNRKKLREGVRYFKGNKEELVVNGIYDKDNKRYWNKVSGNWVGKKVYDFDNWFWGYSIYENLNENWIINYLGRFFDGDEVYGVIDKIGWFFEELLLRDIRSSKGGVGGNNGFVYIDDRNIIRILGSKNVRNLIGLFEKIGYIEIKQGGSIKYDKNKRIKSYRVNWNKLGSEIGFKFIENEKLVRGIIKEYSYPVLISNWELESFKKLKLIVDDSDWIDIVEKKYNRKINDRKKLDWGILSKEDYNKIELDIPDKNIIEEEFKVKYRGINKTLRLIQNGWISEGMFKIDGFYGRTHNPISRLNKELREYLRFDDNSVVELDIKSCYVSCLVYLVEYFNSGRKNINFTKSFSKMEGMFINKGLEDLKEKWNNRKVIWSEYYGVDEDYYDLGELDLNFDELLNNWNKDSFEEFKRFEILLSRIELRGLERTQGYYEGRKEMNNEYKYKSVEIQSKIDVLELSVVRRGIGVIGNGMKRSNTFLDKIKIEVDKKIKYRNHNDDWGVIVNYWKKDNWFSKRYIRFVGGSLEDFKLLDKVYYKDYNNGDIRVYGINKSSLSNINKNPFFIFYDNVEDNIKEGNEIDLGLSFEYYENNELLLKENKIDNILWGGGEYEIRFKTLSKKYNIELGELIKMESTKRGFDIDKCIGDYYEKYGVERIISNELGVIKDDVGGNKLFNYGKSQLDRWRDLIYDKGEFGIDFYNWCEFNIVSLNQNTQSMYQSRLRNLYGRDYFKELVMRLLFSPTHIEKLFKEDVKEDIFGNLSLLLGDLKSVSVMEDGSGGNIDLGIAKGKNHKYVSMMLGYIEVDVMNNIKNLIDGYNDVENNKLRYIQIHDGLLMDKKEYNKWKFVINKYLRDNVGYMFVMN